MTPTPLPVASAALVLALILSGCGGGTRTQSADAPATVTNLAQGPALPGFPELRDLSGTVDPVIARPRQALTSTDGTPFSLAERPADELTVVFWGYTNCPDICPFTMADLARARDALPAQSRERMKVVFITEDPARDEPAFLRTWLDRFDESFTALIGGNPATEQMLTQLHLPQTTGEPADGHGADHGAAGRTKAPVKGPGGEYLVDHTGVVYAFVPGGGAVVYTGGVTSEDYLADFQRLLG
ncbi:MAG: SCO family protein [Sporichthyaceae bacterium]